MLRMPRRQLKTFYSQDISVKIDKRAVSEINKSGYYKRRNRSQILKTILEKGSISRRDIAEETGFARATVGYFVEELIDCGLVREIGIDTSATGRLGGPIPILLSISAGKPYVLSVHIGSTLINVGLLNLKAEPLNYKQVAISQKLDEAKLLSVIGELAETLCREEGLSLQGDVVGVGVGVGGIVDSEEGKVLWHRHKSLRGIHIRERLEEMLGLPVFVENIIQAMALAESWFGKGRLYQNYLFFFAGGIVGSAIVANGSVLKGSRNLSCLVGHSFLKPNGPLGSKKASGIEKDLMSDGSFIRHAEKYVRARGGMLASKQISKEAIIKAAEDGDEDCRQILQKRGQQFGRTIADIVNVVDLQAVILAMNFNTPESDIEYQSMYEAYWENLQIREDAPQIIISRSNGKLLLMGAATLVIEKVFSPDLNVIREASGRTIIQL